MPELIISNERTFKNFLRILVFSAAIGGFSDFYGNAILAGVSEPLIKSLGITSVQYGAAAGLTYLGGVAGALSFGYLADLIGRKRTFIMTLVIFIFGVVGTVFAFNLPSLYFFRILTGYGIGADFAPALGMLSEFTPSYRIGNIKITRGKSFSLFWAVFVIGGITAFLVSWAFSISHIGLLEWRYALATAVVAPVIALIIRARIPEPPRWYIIKNRIEDAKSAAKYIGLDESVIEGYYIPSLKIKTTKISEFKPFVFPVLLPLFLAFFLQSIAFTSLTILTPIFLTSLKISSSNAVLFTATAFALPQLIGVMIAFAVIEKLPRRTIAWTGTLCGGISLILIGVFVHTLSIVPLLIMLVIADISNGFVLPVLGGMASEFFSPRTRGTGQGISTSAFRWSGFAGGVLSPIIMLAYGLSNLFYIYGILAIISFLISYFWLTKVRVTGQSLENIAISFLGHNLKGHSSTEDGQKK